MDDKVWAVELDGARLQIRDLPIQTIDKIAKTCDVQWAYIVALPIADLRVAERLIAEAAVRLDKPCPDLETLTARSILDYFVQTDDDLPEVLENGVPQ